MLLGRLFKQVQIKKNYQRRKNYVSSNQSLRGGKNASYHSEVGKTPVIHHDLNRGRNVERVPLNRIIEQEAMRTIVLEFLEKLNLEIPGTSLRERKPSIQRLGNYEVSKFDQGFQELFNVISRVNPNEDEQDFKFLLSHIAEHIQGSEEIENVKVSRQISMGLSSRKNPLRRQASLDSTVVEVEKDPSLSAICRLPASGPPPELSGAKIAVVVGNSLKIVTKKGRCFYFDNFKEATDTEIENAEEDCDATISFKGVIDGARTVGHTLSLLLISLKKFLASKKGQGTVATIGGLIVFGIVEGFKEGLAQPATGISQGGVGASFNFSNPFA